MSDRKEMLERLAADLVSARGESVCAHCGATVAADDWYTDEYCDEVCPECGETNRTGE